MKVGSPLDESNHVGPLIDQQAVEMFSKALEQVQAELGEVESNAEQIQQQKVA